MDQTTYRTIASFIATVAGAAVALGAIGADILAIEREAEGLLDGVLKVSVR